MSKIVPADGLSLDDIPERMRMFRKTHNLSQSDLATLVGKTRATILRWEKEGPGENAPIVVLAMTQLHQRFSARKPSETESPT